MGFAWTNIRLIEVAEAEAGEDIGPTHPLQYLSEAIRPRGEDLQLRLETRN